MKIALWIVLLIPYILAHLLAYPLAPIIALLDEQTAKELFWWFLTPDNPMTGDAGHELRWAGKPVYFKKVAWLWRNRAYGFMVNSLMRAKSGGMILTQGNPEVRNSPTLIEGTVIRYTPNGYWQFYLVKRSFKNKCLRVNLGWKLWDAMDRPLFGQYVFSVNPLMGIN